MQAHRPLQLGLLTRSFSHQQRHFLVVTLLVGVRLDDGEPVTEAELWNAALEQMPEGATLDEAMWKQHGELLVSGAAQAPGDPATALAVKVAFGSFDKTVNVVGDRHWEAGGASAPEPFEAMPLTWERAFGGPDHAPNPAGCGLTADEDGRVRLPNVEDPRRMVATPKDRPAPAGFEAIPVAWAARLSKQGTHDKRWLEQDFPGLARDVDWRCYNLAPADLWLPAEEYFRGDESFRVENMHPEQPVLEGQLPGYVARAMIRRAGSAELEALPTRLDTVRLLPGAKLAALSFRALLEVADDEASDVEQLLGAIEAADAPKPASHYQAALTARLDPDRGALASLRQGELLPEGVKSAIDFDAWDEDDEREGLKQQNTRRKAELELDRARERMREHGLDPDEHGVPSTLPEPEPLPSLDELAEYIDEVKAKAARHEQEAKDKQAALEDEARKACEARGQDFDKLKAAAQDQGGGPKLVDADATLEDLRAQAQLAQNAGIALPVVEQALADPELEARLRGAEAQYHQAYRRVAHHLPEAPVPAADEGERLRQRVQLAISSDTSLAEQDLTGAPLSELDMTGLDLTRAFLEKADLRGATLTEAPLGEAVLARARMNGATLKGADLDKANLGEADLREADLTGANLSGAILAKADLRGAILDGATLTGADLSDTQWSGASLAGIVAEDTKFIGANLEGAALSGSRLDGSVFVEAQLADADFTDASLDKVAWVTCDATGACLLRAKANGLRVVLDSKLPSANLQGAQLEEALFAEVDLSSANLSGAQLSRANFTGSDLRDAQLYRAVAREACFVKATLDGANLNGIDLLDGLLTKASIRGSKFEGANLFRAILDDAVGDDQTSFEGADVRRVRRPRRPTS